ncbi:hypothetical protein H4R35_002887 [Dimargaris xerosporica]|nr:hypothetical protein H4R35_002887 [Dimargaris xerosporica]
MNRDRQLHELEASLADCAYGLARHTVVPKDAMAEALSRAHLTSRTDDAYAIARVELKELLELWVIVHLGGFEIIHVQDVAPRDMRDPLPTVSRQALVDRVRAKLYQPLESMLQLLLDVSPLFNRAYSQRISQNLSKLEHLVVQDLDNPSPKVPAVSE